MFGRESGDPEWDRFCHRGLGDTLLAWAADPRQRPVVVVLLVDETERASATIWDQADPNPATAAPQAVATGETLEEAVTRVLGQVGVNPCARCGFAGLCPTTHGETCHS